MELNAGFLPFYSSQLIYKENNLTVKMILRPAAACIGDQSAAPDQVARSGLKALGVFYMFVDAEIRFHSKLKGTPRLLCQCVSLSQKTSLR